MNAGRILVADDQADVREALRLLLKSEGFAVDGVESPKAALQALKAAGRLAPDLLLMDMNYERDTTSGAEGLELLAQARALEPGLPVVVMTGYGSIDLAVEAMRRGARDFVQKPWENARLLSILRTQLELAGALKASHRLEAENRLLRSPGPAALVARSRAMAAVLQVLERVAPTDASVLLLGENGTGKSLVARVLHEASARAERPFITLNAGGLSEGVLESELFGHVKGAFTDAKAERPGRFELADGGTLFLDEIGNAPLSLQAKLLRVLETGEFERVGSSRTQTADVRLVCATNADLDAEVQAGRFRQDLRFRINTIQLTLPPLRDRCEDLEPLLTLFLQRHAARYRKPPPSVAPEALEALLAHPWPGNVRELDHAAERAVLLGGNRLAAADFGLTAAPGAGPDLSLEDMEALVIRKALARAGSATAAAELLGLSRSAIYRRMQRYGITS
ncbi:MAG: sigma-54-dependent Fis family transcriptional regulator [Holophagaceae bacterium]|nr:sigma-54-dependent Fis family transcriptional regulator [Holophagaceae bacterium]